METEHSPFPSDETLAAYIDGRLDEETRRRVAEHIADCPECFDVMQVNREMPNAPVVRHVSRPRNVVSGLAAAAAIVAVLLLTPLRERLWPRDDIRALAAAAPPQRLVDGRLSGFPYQERAKVNRGRNEEAIQELETVKFMTAASEVRTSHAKGVAALVLGHPGVAVRDLELAAKEQPTDARVLNDLSAAYLAVGNPFKANVTAERAWKLAQTPEIAWNLAVAAQEEEKPDLAAAYWHKYLELDPRSPWSTEANERLKRLQSGN